MSKAALLELADRVERAGGPDRELDCDIHCMVTGLSGCYKIGGSPDYTSSLDTAATLAPEGFAVSAEWSPAFPGHAWLYPPDNINDVSFEGVAVTPALALTAACLRARAQQESKDA